MGISRKELAEVLYGVAGNFGDQVDEYTIRIWHKILEQDGVTTEQVKKAAVSILRTRKISKMPTLAEFLEHIEGSAAAEAEAEADIVLKAVRYYGGRWDAAFHNPVTRHLMTTRWPYKKWAASLLESEIKWWRKSFVEAYVELKRNPASMEKAKQLAADAGDDVKQLAQTIGGKQ